MTKTEQTAFKFDLSVIIPAFDEEQYLVGTTLEAVQWLRGQGVKFEVLIIDDGSRDATLKIARDLAQANSEVRVVANPINRGKGYSVRAGALAAQGRQVVFTDADGSTPIAELPRLQGKLSEGYQVAIASRALRSDDTEIDACWYRVLLGRIFNLVVSTLILPGLADTQCGFKLFDGRAAQRIFRLQRAERFSFDVEVLFIARRLGYCIAEVPVNWKHMPGSSVNLVRDSIKMFLDIFRFRFNGLLGRYSDR